MRCIRVLAAGLLAIAVSALPAPAAQAKAKTQFLPNGTVTSVTATSLVVTALGKDSTFAVDAKTKVVGKGVGTKSKAKGDKPSIVDLVNVGDRVTITYRDIGGTMHASKIEVASKSAR